MTSFGVRLRDAMHKHGPVCVGIDPHPPLLRAWGLTEDTDGLAKFTDACVEAFAGRVALVKPQVAFFETYGSGGIAVLENAIAALRAAGTLVLADAKRGDIGSTMDAYAHAWLGDGPLGTDAVTVSPYLGFGSPHRRWSWRRRTIAVCSYSPPPPIRKVRSCSASPVPTVAPLPSAWSTMRPPPMRARNSVPSVWSSVRRSPRRRTCPPSTAPSSCRVWARRAGSGLHPQPGPRGRSRRGTAERLPRGSQVRTVRHRAAGARGRTGRRIRLPAALINR